MDGGWCPTFCVFKSLENNMAYTLGIYIYRGKRNLCRTKVLWVLKFGEVLLFLLLLLPLLLLYLPTYLTTYIPSSCAQKLLQKPTRSREQCAHKPIKHREQCANKPIKPLRGPARRAVLFFRHCRVPSVSFFFPTETGGFIILCPIKS